MATFNSSVFTAENAPSIGSRLDGRIVGSGLFVKQVKYELAGTETTSDIINICKLPPGSVPVVSLCNVFCEDPGTTLAIDVGTSADVDELADGIALSNGGLVNFTAGTAPALARTPAAYDREVTVYATPTSVSALTAGADLIFTLVYSKA